MNKMNKGLYIIVGISGSGKGTQTKLLTEYIKNKGGKAKSFSVSEALRAEAGAERNVFTPFVQKTFERGGLLPMFISVSLWTDFLKHNLEENDALILDGIARKYPEGAIFREAVNFLELRDINIINLQLSDALVEGRLLKRGRDDDTKELIRNRIDWYNSDVTKNLEIFEEAKEIKLHNIDGSKSIEEVQKEIINKLEI